MQKKILSPGFDSDIKLFILIADQILKAELADANVLKNIVMREAFKLALKSNSACQQTIDLLIARCELLIAFDDPHALFLRGFMCQYGIGSKVDYHQAIYFYEKAIVFDYPWAIIYRASMHICGQGGPVNYQVGTSLYQQAIMLKYPHAMHALAYICYRHSNNQAAISLYQQAIALNYPPSMNNLATMHKRGEGGPVNWVLAINLFEQAISLGCAEAMINRAFMHQHGLGGLIDCIAAIKLFEQAARYPDIKTNINVLMLHLSKIKIDQLMARHLLICFWPDLLSGLGFTQGTLLALRRHCGSRAIVEKIIADDHGSSLVFLKQLLTNADHPLNIIIHGFVRPFFGRRRQSKSALTMLKTHAKNVCDTRRIFNIANPKPEFETQPPPLPLPIRQCILPFFHPGERFDRQVKLTDNLQATAALS